jgi:SAM-dependent methyltransferase
VTSCPACGLSRSRLLHPSTLVSEADSEAFACTSPEYAIHGPILKCLGCGFVFSEEHLTADEIEACYEGVIDPTYVAEARGRLATFRRQLSRLERYVRPGSMLEVGAYTGVFLSLAKSSGWRVQGIEPSAWAVGQAHELHGLRIRQGMMDPTLFGRETFDAVVMWDVIEHLTDPLATLRGVFDALRPGGIVAISTMDVDSIPARVSRGRWPWFMTMHRVYFSRSTLRRMLEDAGFADVRMNVHIRWVSIGYLSSRMAAALRLPGRPLAALVRWLHLTRVLVPFTIGDLFEAYARKPVRPAGTASLTGPPDAVG